MMPTTTEMTGRQLEHFDPSSCEQLESPDEEAIEAPSSSNNVHTIPSGLSALIRAATSQLKELVEEEHARKYKPGRHHTHHHDVHYSSGATSDDGASSDGGEHTRHPATKSSTTPLMVPETAPLDPCTHFHKGHSSFPEIIMNLALDPTNEDTIAFLPDGKFFAVRSHKFTCELLHKHFEDFSCHTFEEFLLLLHDWGFSRVLHQEDDLGIKSNSTTPHRIEVYRHPKFIKGDWMTCSTIKFGESPTNARLSALPDGAVLDYGSNSSPGTHSSDDTGSTLGIAKRRLSPTSYRETRRDSDFSTATASSHVSHKKRLSFDSTAAGESSTISRSDEIRSVALALTAEKLNLKSIEGIGGDTEGTLGSNVNTPLVDQALKSATHTIVSDAIESLLNDESHTKATYQKHMKELSLSSLPGVIPISKQLFEPSEDEHNRQQGGPQDPGTAPGTVPEHITEPRTSAEEAASVIVEVAIAAQEIARKEELAAAASARSASAVSESTND